MEKFFSVTQICVMQLCSKCNSDYLLFTGRTGIHALRFEHKCRNEKCQHLEYFDIQYPNMRQIVGAEIPTGTQQAGTAPVN